ncbi:serine/threonine-protein kinase [Sulfitobacter mediterraneus]|uniref:Protein kinase-like protein n=1 Tax=Sulfitobacter mediterraneus TaxID=83219 RepID=A0A2T6CD17_9RHOB|nr:serine/threonine-protein kinase [Sulfitobacter mediterraneus]KIN79617.1 putative protein kinase yloP-putative serine/threonine protein kinase [Sulfitobacter mediterraneus KCTC 32188]PTX73399.1 protein kinase-like protein [Sulfitobacter mediterraneus]
MSLYLADLTKGVLVGKGAFGDVHKCIDPVLGVVAGKFIFASNFSDNSAWKLAKRQSLSEARNLCALEHPNTVKVFGVLADPADKEFLISCEFCEHGSARDICKSNQVNLGHAKSIVRDAAMGLSFIHGNGYIHRDVKPDNVLLSNNGCAKVGDFGFVTDELLFGFATPYGTPVYWAPEVYKSKVCSPQSDVYSLGATLFHLVCGEQWFFRSQNQPSIGIDAAGHYFIKENPLYLPHVPKDWRTKIGSLLRHDPSRRCASMSEALNLVSMLGKTENWHCQVCSDEIIWTLEGSKRRVRVVWRDYFKKTSEWTAWSEDLGGARRRALEAGSGSGKWIVAYRSLQKFFQKRTNRIR